MAEVDRLLNLMRADRACLATLACDINDPAARYIAAACTWGEVVESHGRIKALDSVFDVGGAALVAEMHRSKANVLMVQILGGAS